QAMQAPGMAAASQARTEDARKLDLFTKEQEAVAANRKPNVPKAYTAPDGTHFMGIPDESGQIVSTDPSYQQGMVVGGAMPRLASEDTPHGAFNYVTGDDDSHPRRAEKHNGKYVDSVTGEPLPKEARVFSAWS